MKVVKICLLHGKKCHWTSFRYIPRNSQLQVKVCRAPFLCSQQFLTSVWILSKNGSCEKAEICPIASEACKLAENKGAKLPKQRWINCWAYAELIRSGQVI